MGGPRRVCAPEPGQCKDGPDTITAGKTKTYTLDTSLAKNSGCSQATSGCSHVSTTWTKAGQRGRAVTLRDEKRKSVKAKVAAGTAAGTFTLKAQPVYTCKCIGAAAGAAPKNCTDTPNEATIKTAA